MGRQDATIDDLYRIGGKAELVNGEILLMSPGGGLHGIVAGRIFASLLAYADLTHTGSALPDNVGFLVNLEHRRSFSPDVAFTTQCLTRKFVDGAPTFAVEVRSEEDYGPAAEREMAAKRADYFAAGTLVVWDVDFIREHVVRTFRASAPETPTVYHRGDRADAEPAVPGWSMLVDDVFKDS